MPQYSQPIVNSTDWLAEMAPYRFILRWRHRHRTCQAVRFGVLSVIFLSWSVIQHRSRLSSRSDAGAICDVFVHHSSFRDDPDFQLELKLELELLAIERQHESQTLPLRQIWQTWKTQDVPGNLNRIDTWKAWNPQWKYEVRGWRSSVAMYLLTLCKACHGRGCGNLYARQS